MVNLETSVMVDGTVIQSSVIGGGLEVTWVEGDVPSSVNSRLTPVFEGAASVRVVRRMSAYSVVWSSRGIGVVVMMVC